MHVKQSRSVTGKKNVMCVISEECSVMAASKSVMDPYQMKANMR